MVLETTFNALVNKSPNLIPTNLASPYNKNFENIFKINTNNVNTEKPQYRICPKFVDHAFMRSHVAAHILKGIKLNFLFMNLSDYIEFKINR